VLFGKPYQKLARVPGATMQLDKVIICSPDEHHQSPLLHRNPHDYSYAGVDLATGHNLPD
jgi:hypothetical protein